MQIPCRAALCMAGVNGGQDWERILAGLWFELAPSGRMLACCLQLLWKRTNLPSELLLLGKEIKNYGHAAIN